MNTESKANSKWKIMNDNKMSTKTIFGSVNQRRENIRYEFKSRNGKIWEVTIHPWWPMAVWWLGWGEVGLAHHLLWWHLWSLFFLSWIWLSDLNWSEGMIPILTIMPYQTILNMLQLLFWLLLTSCCLTSMFDITHPYMHVILACYTKGHRTGYCTEHMLAKH